MEKSYKSISRFLYQVKEDGFTSNSYYRKNESGSTAISNSKEKKNEFTSDFYRYGEKKNGFTTDSYRYEIKKNGFTSDSCQDEEKKNGFTSDSYRDKEKESGRKKLIGYRGRWYDITNFIEHHPGGEVIEKFVGQDATCVIDSMHKFNVLDKRKAVGNYEFHQRPFDKSMNELEAKFKREGFYDTSVWWSLRKCLFVLLLQVINVTFVHSGLLIESTWRCVISGLLLAVFWQQSGMLMHDFMHSQFFRIKSLDEKIGVFYGTFCFGISARWWKDEHMIHHALTNTVDPYSDFVDPQAMEEAWVQNELLFTQPINPVKAFCVSIQQWIFLPLTIGVGRLGIIIDSFREEKRLDVWIAWLFHWVWILHFLSAFPTWKTALLVYFCGCLGEGVLHVQLLLNHYAKKFYTLQEKHDEEFYRTMIDCNLNIVCPWWFDWFHGGLNFHHEHHSFPRLPRNRLREASGFIRAICAEHGVLYDECGFFSALWRVLCNFSIISKNFRARMYLKLSE